MARYLVVGHQTLDSDELLAELRRRSDDGAQFHVVVPMSHPSGAWSEGSARVAAEIRLAGAMERFRAAGLDVTGDIGDASPVAAVGDALIADPDVDGIIISTFPHGSSAWLSNNVVRRIGREHPDIPLTHVVHAGVPVT